MNLNSFMAEKAKPTPEQKSAVDAFSELPDGHIPEGARNSTLSHLAGCLIKRYGNTGEAWEKFLEKARACDPPLDLAELKSIWGSAVKFGKKLSAQEGYIPP